MWTCSPPSKPAILSLGRVEYDRELLSPPIRDSKSFSQSPLLDQQVHERQNVRFVIKGIHGIRVPDAPSKRRVAKGAARSQR